MAAALRTVIEPQWGHNWEHRLARDGDPWATEIERDRVAVQGFAAVSGELTTARRLRNARLSSHLRPH